MDQTLNEPVTAHMRSDFARLQVDQTVGHALAAIREKPPGGRIIYFYVVDDDNRLCGVVPTRRLLLNEPAQLIRDIMVRDVITIPRSATVLEACEFFLLHKLLAFPVTDEQRRMLGVVDVELYTTELSDLERREGSDDLFQLIGVHVTDSRPTSSWRSFCGRFPWLTANIAGGLAAAIIAGVFETVLQQVVALALFIPVVLALAESVAIQSVSLALQALRGQRPTVATVVRKLCRELVTGLYLGAASGLVVAAAAVAWLGQWRVAACLTGGIVGGVTCAAVIGVSMPNVLRLVHREPQVAAGPVALALTDMATLVIYFSLATWLFT